MQRLDSAQPISITLDGTNYVLWAQAMSSFLRGKKLWRVITGDIIKPTKEATESQDKYADRLADWDSKNHQIITWFRNTSVTSLSLQFGRFQNHDGPAKAIWDFLQERYSSTGLAHQYQLLNHIHHLRQKPGQSIHDFLSQVYGIWDQLALSEPEWSSTTDAQKFIGYRDQQRLILLLMALTIDFEPVRTSLLHRSPLPTLEEAISELLSEETRLSSLKPKSMDTVLATLHRRNHMLLNCPVRVCKHCHQVGPGHYQSHCLQNPDNANKGSPSNSFTAQPSAGPTAIGSRTATAPTSSAFNNDVEDILKKLLSMSNTQQPAVLSTVSSEFPQDPWDKP
ncbi:hypothetical protein RHSIM_Rhsim04G0107400 [Rhododendron simsii]|uniref:Retrotransposon Copia-like N-terminal domain-containing protein n=1 Tax=Rhododendron simsii TaxID=118357 RepID=A0A834LPU3_RHOSS|nr:hypothetical protein RHSIM_Rhsim04G0107400 [Rhododendron simsii]